MKVWLILLSAIAIAAAVAEAQSLEGCPNKCGDVEIPYPFGVGQQRGTSRNCFLEKSFSLTCEDSTLFAGINILVSTISLQGSLEIAMFVSRNCFNESGIEVEDRTAFLTISAFTISSTANKFITIGCDTYSKLIATNNYQTSVTGCITQCDAIPDSHNRQKCSGIGCCQVDIPLGMRNITLESFSFDAHSRVLDFNNCSYAFVAKQGWFNFSLDHLYHFPFDKTPFIVDWTVSNVTCKIAKTRSDYACTSNTYCADSIDGFGYNCRCNPGFEGNPYHPDGCRDIDECQESTHTCLSQANCRNTFGSFECFCPPDFSGNGTLAARCEAPFSKNPLTPVLAGTSAGFLAIIVGMSWLYLVYQKRKLIKLKHRFFSQNGGYILQQQLSVKETQTAKIFTAEELKKATNNYDDSLIIGKGGFGTVYKGHLTDNTIVAIKKSKVVDQSQIEQFINEVVVLSQINHRNVVKLLGCCLETEVPLLVYEFVNNGTVYDYIHNKTNNSNITWETRLRIAAEAAGALTYLHSAASIPIIHRDVKTSNILLDETYTAKVSDFGASRLVPLDETGQLATIVTGTLGYLDPEYMQTNQLTVKSDVYSFGVVLAELLTGKKALSFDRSEEERNLAMHFLSYLNRGHLFEIVEVGLVNEENKQRIHDVGVLAARCMRIKGEERPSMKEVAMELEGIIRMKRKHPWVKENVNLKESEALLCEISDSNENEDSSSSHSNTELDSTTDHVLINLNDDKHRYWE
ncbi:putative wall-associated receptor kinase-like 16 [Senna tora]|uniref:Putative wall-associated receptor kinase-like 16 n=1 Tax=Senna tora TaxID=362788 RepID=A0A834WB40_9FABA|nr:putative wall-associated receptor kinase-like 16 [Senna tora]